MSNIELINKLNKNGILTKDEFISLLKTYTDDDLTYAQGLAVKISNKYFKKQIYIRGLIEFTNICKQDCLYCGIRCSNSNIERYRLTNKEILARGLAAMDSTATSFAMDNNIPIHVFGLDKCENIYNVIMGVKMGTVVKGE